MIEFANLHLHFESRKGPASPRIYAWRVRCHGVLKEQVSGPDTYLVDVLPCCPQVAARTGETGVRRRTQAMSRSTSKRRSRFSSLWGLDTTSKKKQGRPSINQVGFRADEKASTQNASTDISLSNACGCVCALLTQCYLKWTSWHEDVIYGRCF